MKPVARSGWAALLGSVLWACTAGEGNQAEEVRRLPTASPLGRAQEGDPSACPVPAGCEPQSCDDDEICRARRCETDDSGTCEDLCPVFDCLSKPPYCNNDTDCAGGQHCTSRGLCTCSALTDCGDTDIFHCPEKEDGEDVRVCANRPCRSRTDCCDVDGGNCRPCLASGVCEAVGAPPFSESVEPSLSCGVRGAGLTSGGAAACALACGAALGALGAGALRRRRRQKKGAAAESCGTQSRKGP